MTARPGGGSRLGDFMSSDSLPPLSRFAGLGWLQAFLWGAAFAIAYVQAPPYYSNQNQYFLHGLAAHGRGDLAHDWLANTRDPTPIFSAAVGWMYSNLGEWSFVATYGVILGVYFVSLIGLIDATIGLPQSAAPRFVYLTVLVVLAAAGARWLSLWCTRIDIPRMLNYGVAGQYVLGSGLQPSVFGVLLIVSMAAFVRKHLVGAVAAIAASCSLHATYLLPAALITTAYMVVLVRDGRLRASLLLGAGTLLSVLPILIFGLVAFAPTTPEQFNEAQRLLVFERIPHHCVVAEWWDWAAKLQVAWLIIGIVLAIPTRLFPLLAIPTMGGLALTLVQITSGSSALALIFPWRISAVVIPVATAVIVARVVNLAAAHLGHRSAIGAATVLVGAIVSGIYLSKPGLAYPSDEAEWPLLNFVREHRQPGDVYFVPITIPVKGVALGGSLILRPVGKTRVPVNLQRFRLSTGAPIYVDFKSIPYLDVEVLEWNRRLQQAKAWCELGNWSELRDQLKAEGVTHIVVPADHEGSVAGFERVYADDAYRVYRLPR